MITLGSKPQPLEYDIVEVPAATAVTNPPAETVATAVLELPHAPSVDASVSVVVVPLHIIEVPPFTTAGCA